MRYQVSLPTVPGNAPSSHPARTLGQARKLAKILGGHRKDLTYQDVRIETANGSLIEYAGPCR